MTTTNSNAIACASASIDMSAIPASVPSLCIPRVFANVTRERIAKVFEELDLGIIERIDLVSKVGRDNGDKFQRVFIHFRSWGGNSNAIKARERVLQGKEIKIIYDDPWFWKVSANRAHDSSSAAPAFKRPEVKKKISIDFDCDSSTPSRPVDNVKRPTYDNRPKRDQGQGQGGKPPYKKPITKLVIKKEEPEPVKALEKEKEKEKEKAGEEGEIVETK